MQLVFGEECLHRSGSQQAKALYLAISGPSAANELCIHLDNTQLTFGESRTDVSCS